MTSEQEQKYRDTLAKASSKIKELTAQVNELKGTGRVAVVGIGCRFPGGGEFPGEVLEISRDRRRCSERDSAGPLDRR